MRCDNCFSLVEEAVINGRGMECFHYCESTNISLPIDPEYGEDEDENDSDHGLFLSRSMTLRRPRVERARGPEGLRGSGLAAAGSSSFAEDRVEAKGAPVSSFFWASFLATACLSSRTIQFERVRSLFAAN